MNCVLQAILNVCKKLTEEELFYHSLNYLFLVFLIFTWLQVCCDLFSVDASWLSLEPGAGSRVLPRTRAALPGGAASAGHKVLQKTTDWSHLPPTAQTCVHKYTRRHLYIQL